MNEINWSKAPSNAVAAFVTKPGNIHHPQIAFATEFYRFGCTIRGTDVEGQPLCAISDCWDLIERPINAAWNGQGLPPAGTECEWTGTKGGFWVRSTVVAANDYQVVMQHAKDGEYKPGEFDVRNVSCTMFRRIRTDAEVLAEHQKAMAIGAMLEMIDGLDLREACQVLYEDDYRKVEIGDREETIKAIQEAAKGQFTQHGISFDAAAAIYDAGYCKVES